MGAYRSGIFLEALPLDLVRKFAIEAEANGVEHAWFPEITWRFFPDKPYKMAYCEDPFSNIIEIYSHSTEQTWSNA